MKNQVDPTPIRKAAGVLIYARDTERFLLVRRSDLVTQPNLWSIPGGTVDEGESIEDAAIREVYEETAIDLSNSPIILLARTKLDTVPRSEYYTYAAILNKEINPVLNWESSAARWIQLDSIPLQRHPGIDLLLANSQAGERLHSFVQKNSD